MNLRSASALVVIAIPATLVPVSAVERRAPEPVSLAVVRSLSLMQKSMAEYPRQRTCFSCHHQGVPMFALSFARKTGYAIDEKILEAVVRHTEADLRGDIELYSTGKGQPGGVTRAGYALLALQSGGVK